MHQDLWANLKRMKNTAVLRFWHLYLVFIHANRVPCSLKTKHDVMNVRQRRAFTLFLLSDLLFQRAPKAAWKAFANEDGGQLAEYAAALGFPGAAASSSQAEAGAVRWPLPFLLLSLLPVSLTLSLVPYRHLSSTGLFAHSCVWHFFFLFPASCLPLSFTGSFLKKCNLCVSEMPVLVKPRRTQALPSLTPRTSLFMTHQDLPGSPQVTGTFTHSYQPLRA